jgi:hypothetical protein
MWSKLGKWILKIIGTAAAEKAVEKLGQEMKKNG